MAFIIIMDIMLEFRQDVLKILTRAIPKKECESCLEKPPENIGSDLAFPCFVMAKKLKRNPAEIAREISEKLKPSGLVGEVNFYGPYVNFFIDWEAASEKLIRGILKEDRAYGKAAARKEKFMIEYAHPNTHKAFHIGHVRNIALGESLCRVLDKAGYKVVRTNYQGDIGPHVAKCIWGFLNIYKGKSPANDKGRWLGKVYKDGARKIAKSKKAEKEMREINSQLYSRDKKILPVWKKTRQWSLDYYNEIYNDFWVKFDRLYFESEVEAQGLKISEGLVRKGLAKVSDDAIIADLEKQGLGIFVLVTKDKTPLYHAKDLALAELQVKEHKPDRIIHVVGSEQTTYFKQLFRFLEIMKWRHYAKEMHLVYELVNLGTGKKMKSREGEVILYDELKDKILALARKETKKKNPRLSGKELDKISRMVGMGALKYSMISQSPGKVIVFDWDRVLSFDGNTGPYLQYSHARARSILRKAGKTGKPDSGVLTHEKEVSLLRKMAEFPDVVKRSAEDLRPHYIAGYAFDLATRFNEFYQSVPVLKADAVSRPSRLAMVEAFSLVIRNALDLMGIDVPERM